MGLSLQMLALTSALFSWQRFKFYALHKSTFSQCAFQHILAST